jgi:polar amino acid transport system substrate-binding protein
MMRRLRVLLCGLLVFLTSGLGAQALLTTGDWAPFTGEKLVDFGAATAVVAAALKAGGVQYKLEFYPWNRAEKMVLDGQAFATFPYVANDERRAKYDFSEPLFSTSAKVFFLKKNARAASAKIASVTDLKNYTVVFLAGQWFESNLKDAGVKYSTAPSLENVVKMLYAGRADFMIEEGTVGMTNIQSIYGNTTEFDTKPSALFGKDVLHLMVSRTYPGTKDLLTAFNRGLRTIKANGVLSTLAKKYNLSIE